MQRWWRSLALLLAAAASLWAAQAPVISPQQLEQHIRFLASPALKGRGTGTPELTRAARYIAAAFRTAGLEPAAPATPGVSGKSFYQKFRVTTGAQLGRQNRAEFFPKNPPNGSAAPLQIQQDYIPLNFSDSGEARVPVVFAGYGITAPEYHYDDYAPMDAAGKAVVVLRHEPQEDDEKSVFEGRVLSPHAEIVNKAINARNHGARAMILVNDPVPHPNEEDRLVKFGTLSGPENAGLLLIHVKRAVVEEWLRASGKTLEGLQRAMDAKLEPQSFALPEATLALRVDVRRITAMTQNVVGVLRGTDPKLADEAIVIGAHYDHLGLGQRNSLAPSQVGQIHPGADDNASGTAALLELASALHRRQRDLRRSIVFLAFSGEELGLLGSAYYTKHPAWRLERTVAMLNLDMVGHGSLAVGSWRLDGPLVELAVRTAGELGLGVTRFRRPDAFSDHVPFEMSGIPTAFFHTGEDPVMHTPGDVVSRVDPRLIVEAVRLAGAVVAAAGKVFR